MTAGRRAWVASDGPRRADLPRPLGFDTAQGRSLDHATGARMRAALGHDFSAVRIHTDAQAARSAQAIGARAFTLGADIAFAPGQFAPHTRAGSQLLAHELAHTIQQRRAPGVGSGVAPASPDALRAAEAEADRAARAASEDRSEAVPVAATIDRQPQFDLVSPGRLATVHANIFPVAPAPGAGTAGASRAGRLPWRDASAPGGGAAALIKRQARAQIERIVRDEHRRVEGFPIQTDEADVDADVLTAHARLRARFPQITVTVTDAQLQAAAGALTSSETSDPDFLRAWLWNALIGWTDIEDYAITDADPRAVAMLDELLANRRLGSYIRAMARRVAGMHTGTGLAHRIRISRGANATERSATLIHELTHMFAHAAYTRWVATTANEDLYDEGMTEWLARRAMTSAERALPTSYGPRVQAVDTQIAAHVSEDDLARAYFQGEVWRLETRSSIARGEFERASGLRAGASAREEASRSRAGPGINQEVVPDAHYRFLNLGNDRADPKAEHVDYFRRLKVRLLDPQPSVEVKFVGHASSPGTWAHNDRLSLLRARAFYRMARDQGVAGARLRDAASPEHHGEHVPTLTEEDAQTRAFNRRVELFLTGVARTPGTATGTASAPATERED